MALKVHRVVVVGCPRCVLTGGPEKQGVGKSCFCNRFVRPDNFQLQHPSTIREETWRDDATYNGDHFLYWGAATKRHADGSKTRFQVVEQTEFFDVNDRGEIVFYSSEADYVSRATATHFISRGKVAYKLNEEEEYAIPSSLRSNPMRARAVQLFPNNEFSEGKGVSGFICLFDPTLEGENIKIQFDFLTSLINQLLKTKRKIVVACTKCDEVNDARIQFGANLVSSIKAKKPIPYIETSAKEGINVEEPFLYIVGNYQKKKRVLSKSGKNSPVVLGPTFSEVMKSRGKDQAFARTTLNRLIKEKVNSFSTEWSNVWPYLQLDPSCHKAVDLIGVEETKKMFCQRLMELKVLEVKEKYRQKHKMQEEQSRSYQAEIFEAFSTHPDLT